MTEELYSPYKLAIELGFTEALARHYEKRGTNATNLRKIAVAMDLPGTKPTIAKPPDELPPEPDAEPEREPVVDEHASTSAVTKHKHSYRKDGTCACGAVKKARQPKQPST